MAMIFFQELGVISKLFEEKLLLDVVQAYI
jgi:hypothetical protein